CLLLYSDRECGVLLGERRLKRRHLPPSRSFRCGVFLGELWMLWLPLRQRTVQRPVSLSYSSTSSFANPFSSLLLPLPPFVQALPLPRHHPPPPSFTRSSQPPAPLPLPLALLHFITDPAPRFPAPIPTVPSPFSYSAPDSPLSIILLRPRQPPSTSSTPLFALSTHLPLPFPSP
ncbi:unnamed protein product, partial [Musa acuminata var. zebrina]